MKIFHLSDLHLGKRLCEYSLIDDQQYILARILDAVDTERPDALIIAGDVYDKPIPSAEAVALFDNFITELASKCIPTFVISGNHDSPERIAFGASIMGASGVYMSPVFEGDVTSIRLSDEHGDVYFYLLPFIKPAHVRRVYPDDECNSYTDALAIAISHMSIDESARNVLVTHQFVTGASRSESEEISVGGSDNVDARVFECFDYVALGHIHGPQSISHENIRYSGTPLKYSFSEAGHTKSITCVTLGKKGDISVDTIPLVPLRDLREIRGSFDALTSSSYYEHEAREDYLHITLTDEEDVPEALTRLRAIYPNLMKLDYDNTRTRTETAFSLATAPEKRSPIELFCDFFEMQNGRTPDGTQREYLSALIEKIWEGDDK